MKLPSVTALVLRSFATACRSFQKVDPVPTPGREPASLRNPGDAPRSHTILHCRRCKTIFPLSAPRQIGNVWYAQCGDCLYETEVEPEWPGVESEPTFRIRKRRGLRA